MPIDFELHPGFDAGKYAEAFQRRGWNTQLVKVGNLDIVKVDPASAVECGDGRFARREKVKKSGHKLMGGSNFVAAAKTGGTLEGFDLAAKDIVQAGLRPGFHKGCGMYELWLLNRLENVAHGLVPPQYDPGEWVRNHVNRWNGKHFDDIYGDHEEDEFVFNPLLGVTPRTNVKRFGHDQGLAVSLGINPDRSLAIAAEVVEKLSSCRRVTILIP